MKRAFIYIIAILSLALGCRAADGDLFPYPKPTDDMTGLTERCDFLVSKFWNHCNFKGALSKKKSLTQPSATGFRSCPLPPPTPYTQQ